MPMPRDKLCERVQETIGAIMSLPPGAEPLGIFIVMPCQDGRIIKLVTYENSCVERWAVLGAANMAITEEYDLRPIPLPSSKGENE